MSRNIITDITSNTKKNANVDQSLLTVNQVTTTDPTTALATSSSLLTKRSSVQLKHYESNHDKKNKKKKVETKCNNNDLSSQQVLQHPYGGDGLYGSNDTKIPLVDPTQLMQMYQNTYGNAAAPPASTSPAVLQLLSSYTATTTAAAVAVARADQLLHHNQQQQHHQSMLLYNQLVQQQQQQQQHRYNARDADKAMLQESNDVSTISPMMMTTMKMMMFNSNKEHRSFPSNSTSTMLHQQIQREKQQERQDEEEQTIVQNLLTKLYQNINNNSNNNEHLNDHPHAHIPDVIHHPKEQQEMRQRLQHGDNNNVTNTEMYQYHQMRDQQLQLQMINNVLRHHELNQTMRHDHHSIDRTTAATSSSNDGLPSPADVAVAITSNKTHQEFINRNGTVSPRHFLNYQNLLLSMQQEQQPYPYHTLSSSASSTMHDIVQRMNTSALSSGTYHSQVPSTLVNYHDGMMKNLYSTYPPISSSLSSSIPVTLPVLIVQPLEDRFKLSDQQFLLRQQIEIFEAGHDDVSTHTRGRNKPISYGQVGIRCKHCAHVPVSKRQKGSTYFPSNILGIYQAAQNMCATHIQCGICEYMPLSIKQQFAQLMSNRNSTSNGESGGSTSKNTNQIMTGSGRPYWAKAAKQLGLFDTEFDGIRFIRSKIQHYETTSMLNNTL